MLRYILNRTLRSILTVVIVFVTVFMLLRFMPLNGYFTDEMLKVSDEQTRMAYLRNQGLLDPPFSQLWRFVKNLFAGDLGRSLTVYPKVPITILLCEKIPVTAAFGAASLVLGMTLGLLMGMFMARYKERLGDTLGTFYVVFVRAVPSLIYLFFIQVWVSGVLKLPLVFYEDRPESWILPTICLSLGSIAWYAIWLRRFMVDEENRDYVKFAMVKGLSKKYVLRRHLFKNAIIPIAIYLPSDILFIISGSLIIESLYAIPGTGGLLTKAIQKQDNNLVQVIVLMYAILSVLGVFLGDLLVAFVDPRIRLTEDEG
ncbi:MAG: Oligopeptide transport system permease protein OppB [Firmicutes bacterium ADurb.Bin248]|nr:MAG: Oligopeptide transport system permease protein OppB [Firmicutes bacterium ADurb.Bin248]